MRWSRAAPAATTVLVLIAGAALYPQFIPVTHVVHTRLARLVIATPPAGELGTKPTASPSEVPADADPFPGVVTAGKRSPNATGAYYDQWTSPTNTNVADEVLASLLPNQADANTVLTQAKAMFVGPKAAPAQGYVFKSTFAVPSIPGASGAVFTSTTAGSAPLGAVVFQDQRVVVVAAAFAQGTPATSTTAAATTATALAAAESKQLRTVVPGFSLVRTTRPLVASIVYAAGTIAAALALGTLVVLFGWWRRRRAQKEAVRLELIRQARDRDRRKRAARHAD